MDWQYQDNIFLEFAGDAVRDRRLQYVVHKKSSYNITLLNLVTLPHNHT